MKINITSTSSFCEKNILVEANSIEDAIKQIKGNKALLETLTEQEDPEQFVLTMSGNKDYDYELEIYDYWRE